MIHTRFGSEVTPIGFNKQSGFLTVKRVEDQVELVGHISEFRADGGAAEIMKALSVDAGELEPEDHTDDICPCGDIDCNRPFGHAE